MGPTKQMGGTENQDLYARSGKESHLSSQWVTCGNQPGSSDMAPAVKVTGISGASASGLSDMTNSESSRPPPVTEAIGGRYCNASIHFEGAKHM